MNFILKLTLLNCLFLNLFGTFSFDQLKDIENSSKCNFTSRLSHIFAFYINYFKNDHRFFLSYDKKTEIKEKLYFNHYFDNTGNFYDLVLNSSQVIINFKRNDYCDGLNYSVGTKKIQNISDLNLDYEISTHIDVLNLSYHQQLESEFMYLVRVQLYFNLTEPTSEKFTIQTYLIYNKDESLLVYEKIENSTLLVKVDKVDLFKATFLKFNYGINYRKNRFINNIIDVVLTNMG